jgi:putative transposon-encoded protein
MKNETVLFKRKLTPIGGSLGITIPKEVIEFLGIKEGSEICLSGYNGKHGKYVAFWVGE